MFFSRTHPNDICFPIGYCTIYFGKSKPLTIKFSTFKGVFFVQFGAKKLIYLISAFLLAWLTLRLLLPLFSPFLFGLLLALAAEPAVRLLSKRLHLPRSVSTGIGVSMTFFLLCTVLLLLGAFLLREIKAFAGLIPDLTFTFQKGIAGLQSWAMGLLAFLPLSIRPLLQENIQALFSSGTALLDQTFRYILNLTGSLLSHVPDSALGAATAVLSAFMISGKLPRLKLFFRSRLSPERRKSLLETWNRLKHAASRWFTAQIKLMGVTFLLLLGGFLLLRIRHPFLCAAGVALVDAFPVLGTGTVLIPWAIGKAIRGDRVRAVALGSLYITVSLTRSMLEPKLVSRHLGLDPLVTLAALYAGFRLWGIGGMILAPLLTVTALQILPQQR